MRHGPERGRKIFRGIGAMILGREGDGWRLAAAVASNFQRRRQTGWRKIVATALGRTKGLHRHQRRAPPRTVLRAIQAFAPQRVSDKRLGLIILPSHAAGVEAVRDVTRRSLADEPCAALAEEFLIAVADGTSVEGLIERRMRVLYAVPVAATLVRA